MWEISWLWLNCSLSDFIIHQERNAVSVVGSIGEEKSWGGENRVIYNIGYWKAPPIWEGFRCVLRVPHVWHLLKVTENLDWVMAQWLACLLQECEDLGSDSQHTWNLDMVACIWKVDAAVGGGQGQVDLGLLCQLMSAKQVQESPCLKNRVEKLLKTF